MLNDITQEQIAGLDSYVIKGDADAPYIILMHGYGANFQDLLSLSQAIKLPFSPTWVFPNAPLEADLGFGPLMRTWFPWDSQMVEKLANPEMVDECVKACTEGLSGAEQQLNKFIQALDTPASNIFIGGFSQGAVLASYLALRYQETFKGLIIFSGALLLDKEAFSCFSEKKRELPFFQSHGTEDPLLGYDYALSLNAALKLSGLTGELLSFPGGHEIPWNVLHAVGEFLKQHTNNI